MSREQRIPPKKTVTVLDEHNKLYEVGSKDVWQLPLVSRDGRTVGVVVKQVVEPSMYTVRYLVVFSPEQERQFVVPATAVTDISAEGVHCNLTVNKLEGLPTFSQTLSLRQEKEVYSASDQTPYWVEEKKACDYSSTHHDE